MNRHAQALIVADLLAHGHGITLLDQGLAGCTNVLGHGDYQNIGLREAQCPLFFSVPFIFFGVYPSEKGKRHNCHLFQNPRDITRIL